MPELQQAVFEASLLEKFQHLATPAAGQGPPAMRIPRFLGHSVEEQAGGGWRVRMAMSRVPGECLDSFLKRAPPPEEPTVALRRGVLLAAQLVRQLAPTLDRIAPHAWHRDVNSHNVLLGDAADGGKLIVGGDPEEAGRSASFWLIDFGLAVDAATWPTQWPTAYVAGDVRYWPPSSFAMSFYGPSAILGDEGMCTQYKTRLDVAGLGLTALEVLCSTALSSKSENWGGVSSSWTNLLEGWAKYWGEVTRWHTTIFHVFARGGDMTSLYQKLHKEHVVDRVAKHIVKLRELLRKCAASSKEADVRRLLYVLANMIDEDADVGMRKV